MYWFMCSGLVIFIIVLTSFSLPKVVGAFCRLVVQCFRIYRKSSPMQESNLHPPTLSSSLPTSGLLVDLSTICAGALPIKLMGHNENLKELWSIHRVIYVWSSKIFVVFKKNFGSSGAATSSQSNRCSSWRLDMVLLILEPSSLKGMGRPYCFLN